MSRQLSRLQFPYAEKHLDNYVRSQWDNESCQECLRLAREKPGTLAEGAGDEQTRFIDGMRRAMHANLKLTSLKRLQGALHLSPCRL